MNDGSAWDSAIDESAFRREQERLGRCWTFLGLTAELERDNDWLRARLGGRSVFVQRMGDKLVGFENVCPHRFFPLRTKDRGNGPIVCGFHHWHFDRTGTAVGIPICRDLYDRTPREMQARLTPIEIEVCGSLIFGRFAAAGGPSLEAYLGPAWPILTAATSLPPTVYPFSQVVASNWRFMMSITLDGYHNVAVHRAPRNHRNSDFQYARFGLHSAHIGGQHQTFSAMVEQCAADGRAYNPNGYRILNIFPDLAVSIFAARPCWYAAIQQFVPLTAGRSLWRGWVFRTVFPVRLRNLAERLAQPVPEPIRAHLVRRGLERIANQDHEACERLQEVAAQAGGNPLLGAQEERLAWFQEAYDSIVHGRSDSVDAG
ncbi:MAG: Rieske 2Fe-2S domain-containing protein [Reyranellaceae bacterium]